MEASSVMMGSSQMNLSAIHLGFKQIGFCSFSKKMVKNDSKIWIGERITWSSKSCFGVLSVKASGNTNIEAVVSSEKSVTTGKSKMVDDVRLYVGLPLDTVSKSSKINHARAIAAGLKALKLLGVDGVELPIWWGVVEKEATGKYEWSGYLAVAELVKKLGLKLHVSLNFHASEVPKIPLPEWVSRIGESDPNIFFTDRSGQRYKDCLSLAVDDLPVLDGKTPVQVYKEFFDSFKASFSRYMGSIITGISIGLGPDGELRYPSHHQQAKNNNHLGAGEFQCYDKNMLRHLKQHAEASGNPLWGLSGPHDAPGYNVPPTGSNFFKDHGGSWETPYGDFFLSWYSSQLLSHGDRIISLASSTFHDLPITVSGKIPLMHSWYKTRSHPAELTAGFYNTVNKDGYAATAEMFSRHSCKMVLPGMDLCDEHQQNESLSSPQLLLEQITSSCRKHGVEVSGENSLVSGAPRGFEQIKKSLIGETATVDMFTYQRMGADFFSPEHFPSFTGFVRYLKQPQLHPDDLILEERENVETPPGANIHMQSA